MKLFLNVDNDIKRKLFIYNIYRLVDMSWK